MDGADGYRVTVYQDKNGSWVNTGFGYDLDNSVTALDMALTVGGAETAESKNLSANETYRIGVSRPTEPLRAASITARRPSPPANTCRSTHR